MKIIEISELQEIFLEELDNSKKILSDSGEKSVDDINYRDKNFLEYGYYLEAIKPTASIDTTYQTPGIFTIDSGAILNNPNYKCYTQQIALEFLAFEDQRQDFRKLLEMYSSELRGKVLSVYYDETTGEYHFDDGITTGVKYTIVVKTELPVLSETVEQSGYDRFQAYINMEITVLLGVKLSTEIPITIDEELIAYKKISFARNKVSKVLAIKSKENKSYAESQAIAVSIEGIIKDNSSFCDKLLNGILSEDYLNQSYTLKINDKEYIVYLASGSINLEVGNVVMYTASFYSLKEI